ncbi:cell division protein ZapC domain-containing protein [Gallaecimonas sp. GXIMD4217]|uniref:cell division protein ZapC domain-containing protein n=1 Tax=Gallaecimonas sp. GXIMD4217 TaxID=3131927 RepID=UPI00311AE1F4
MILEPKHDWTWHFDDATDRLELHLGELCFVTPYHASLLIPDARRGAQFDMDDADYYRQVLEALALNEGWSAPERVQIALNACAIRRFAKPTMPRSWFFAENPQGRAQVQGPALLSLQTPFGRGQCLAVECFDSSTLCMLLEAPLALSERKTMAPFDVVKVMNDRLWPSQWQIRRSQYRAVG